MTRTLIQTDAAPKPVGPYAQAVQAGSMLFTAGQIGIDPATGRLVEGLEAQTRQVLANLAALLAAGGSSPGQVIKTTIFLTDMAHFAAVNTIYGGVFAGSPPARSTVAVSALPLGALVEIELIALCE